LHLRCKGLPFPACSRPSPGQTCTGLFRKFGSAILVKAKKKLWQRIFTWPILTDPLVASTRLESRRASSGKGWPRGAHPLSPKRLAAGCLSCSCGLWQPWRSSSCSGVVPCWGLFHQRAPVGTGEVLQASSSETAHGGAEARSATSGLEAARREVVAFWRRGGGVCSCIGRCQSWGFAPG